ncbi:MAG: alkaline phosphatase family protein [Woeseiaceae bacterium]|nr:alkaline phosphatase family protein [Woeseiaceae bacterium]
MNKKKNAASERPPSIRHGFTLLAALTLSCLSGVAMSEASSKAIFIIVDGIPADVLESTPTPNFDDISGAGGYTRAWVGGEAGGESESPTVSAVGYNSLITGTWSNKHNVYDNDVNDPNYAYWDIFRIAKKHDSSLQTALFSTWTDNRTKLIGDGLPEAGGYKLDFTFDGLELDAGRFPHDLQSNYIRDIDATVAGEAARHVRHAGPDLSWVYLQYTDDIGHRHGDGPKMTAAVSLMDEWVGQIWDAVKAREASHAEDWMLVVTTDHGRNAETGRGHGCQTERERTIWISTNHNVLNANFGPDAAIVDILPSIATHLGLSMPDDIRTALDGQSFID